MGCAFWPQLCCEVSGGGLHCRGVLQNRLLEPSTATDARARTTLCRVGGRGRNTHRPLQRYAERLDGQACLHGSAQRVVSEKHAYARPRNIALHNFMYTRSASSLNTPRPTAGRSSLTAARDVTGRREPVDLILDSTLCSLTRTRATCTWSARPSCSTKRAFLLPLLSHAARAHHVAQASVSAARAVTSRKESAPTLHCSASARTLT